MATYYVDFSVIGGSHTGSSGDPFSLDEANNTSNGFPSGQTFLCRGSFTDFVPTQGVFNVWENVWDAWDLNLYGPWRLNLVTQQLYIQGQFWANPSGFIKSAILNSPFSAFEIDGNLTYENCYFVGDLDIIDYIGSIFKGCIIYGSITSSYQSDPTDYMPFFLEFIDSIIRGTITTTFDFPPTVTLTNTVLTTTTTYPKTHCQENWSAPAFPAWNASKSAFTDPSLYAGITFPPNPGDGYPSFTGYPTDLFGDARTGVGFGGGGGGPEPSITSISYFLVPSVADSTSVTSYINQPVLITAIQSDSPDSYFDSSNKLGKVYVYYTHELGRERKKLVHVAPDFQAPVQWSPFAKDGTWQKTEVKAYDKNGAVHVLLRGSIGTDEDLDHTSGSTSLNIT